MKVEQKSYAQILIVSPDDFISPAIYNFYERRCPFACFPGISAKNFRCILKNPEQVEPDKDLILLLEKYWNLLETNEKKAILDHELGHIVNGDLDRIAEYVKQGTVPPVTTETIEKAADAYSAELNGKKAMYHSLIKATTLVAISLRKEGEDITGQELINKYGILKRRLEILKEE